MAKLVELRKIEAEKINSSSVFQSDYWAKVKFPTWKAFAFSFVVNDKKGNILILTRTFLSCFNLAYVPFAPEQDLDLEELAVLSGELKKALKIKVFLIRYDLPYGREMKIGKPFHLCSESVLAEASVLIDLPHTFCLTSRAKRNINRTKDKYRISVAKSDEEVSKWYECYKRTALRDGFQTRPFSYIKKLLNIQSDNVKPILYLSYKGEDIRGGIINLRGKGGEVYLFGATDKDDGLSPGYLLQYHAISEAGKYNVGTYDMFGIEGKNNRGKHLESLTLFKTAFGGKKVYRTPTFDYYCNPIISRAFRFLEAIRYSFYRR